MRLFEGTEFDMPPKCDRCEKLLDQCDCPPSEAPKIYVPAEEQTAVVAVEKRKRGKIVTVVSGLAAEVNDFATILTRLKNRCGAGGTTKDDTIEIQGDHQAVVAESLADIGYRVKQRNR